MLCLGAALSSSVLESAL